MAKNLMQRISREWTNGIIKNTIDNKPSLYHIPRRIEWLLGMSGSDTRLFDEEIGLDNLFHLIITTGNPRILIQVLGILSKFQQKTLIELFRDLPAEKRTNFILNCNFYYFCKAAAQYPQLMVFPGETESDPRQPISIIDRLIESSEFFSLNSGIRFLEDISPSRLKSLVFDRVSRYLGLLPREKVESASNTEKVNYLALLNRLEKLDANTLHKVIHTMDRKVYVKEKYYFSSLGYLFYVLASREVDASLKQEMLELANADMTASLLDKQELLSVFLFLWNTYSLFIMVDDKRRFNHWLSPAIKEGIFKRLEKNKNLRSINPEYEHLLMLVGLLSYLDLQPSRLRSIFSPAFQLNLSPRYLGDMVEKCKFFQGCFFLQGVEFLKRGPVYFKYWELLAGKPDRYKTQTRALRELLDFAGKRG